MLNFIKTCKFSAEKNGKAMHRLLRICEKPASSNKLTIRTDLGIQIFIGVNDL